jgi:hypothetical protein
MRRQQLNSEGIEMIAVNDEVYYAKVLERHPHYAVSTCGNVISLRRGIVLKPRKTKSGYLTLSIHNEQPYVHRLVAEAFLDSSEGREHINHINGVKTDNSVTNLERVSPKENNHWNKTLKECEAERAKSRAERFRKLMAQCKQFYFVE